MKNEILEFINEQIEQGNVIKDKARERELDTIAGYIQACSEIYEFIEDLDDEE